MNLWNESAIRYVMPDIKVRMPNGKNYSAKIVRVIGNFARVRVDSTIGSLDPYSWSFFQVSLYTIAKCLNEGNPVIY